MVAVPDVAKIIVAVVLVVFMSVIVTESGGNDNNVALMDTKGREAKRSIKCFFGLF